MKKKYGNCCSTTLLHLMRAIFITCLLFLCFQDGLTRDSNEKLEAVKKQESQFSLFRLIFFPVKLIWWTLISLLKILIYTLLIAVFLIIVLQDYWVPRLIELAFVKTNTYARITSAKCSLFRGHLSFQNIIFAPMKSDKPSNHGIIVKECTIDMNLIASIIQRTSSFKQLIIRIKKLTLTEDDPSYSDFVPTLLEPFADLLRTDSGLFIEELEFALDEINIDSSNEEGGSGSIEINYHKSLSNVTNGPAAVDQLLEGLSSAVVASHIEHITVGRNDLCVIV